MLLSYQALRAVTVVRRSGMVMGPIAMSSLPMDFLFYRDFLLHLKVSDRPDAWARLINKTVSQVME
jgi:hypothetical protein